MAATKRTFFYIQQVEQLVRQQLDRRLESEILTAGQYMVLSLVTHQGLTSSSELARSAGMTAQSMGEFVKALEHKGLVERCAAPDNRRILLIASTTKGKTILRRCDAAVDRAEREFFDCLEPEEVVNLRDMLSRLRGAARERRA